MTALGRMVFVLVALAITSTPAYSQQLFSHAVIRIPEVRVDAPWVQVIETQEEWTAFYLEHYGSDTASLAIPQVDFEIYRVVAGGMGFVAAGDIRLAIEEVYDLSNMVAVSGFAVSPGHDCLVTQMVVWPTTAILIPQSAKPVRVWMTNLVEDCD